MRVNPVIASLPAIRARERIPATDRHRGPVAGRLQDVRNAADARLPTRKRPLSVGSGVDAKRSAPARPRVTAGLALALLDWHTGEGRVDRQTIFVVGRGDGVLRRAVGAALRAKAWDHIVNRHNAGQLVPR